MLIDSAFDVLSRENDELFKFSIPDIDNDVGRLFITNTTFAQIPMEI